MSRTARSKILQTNKSAKLEKTAGLAARNYMEKQFGNLSMDLVKKKEEKKKKNNFMCVAFLADLFQKSMARFEETAIYMYPVIKLIFTIFNIIKITK